MAKMVNDITELIGDAPLVRLNKIPVGSHEAKSLGQQFLDAKMPGPDYKGQIDG